MSHILKLTDTQSLEGLFCRLRCLYLHLCDSRKKPIQGAVNSRSQELKNYFQSAFNLPKMGLIE